ncbi:hypothetical protein [Sphingobium sp. YR768]|uniref:hypothetical protein n=1 Tax=Sphingobium sp. YR768 TaxID=1884365 RepID=UPI0008C43A8C|nr:hypothetical protein [Sphingobium sp. YR768]SES09054.1 hypothetical protein SAMN05518866_13768 [Sphingobium sp. YR768]
MSDEEERRFARLKNEYKRWVKESGAAGVIARLFLAVSGIWSGSIGVAFHQSAWELAVAVAMFLFGLAVFVSLLLEDRS